MINVNSKTFEEAVQFLLKDSPEIDWRESYEALRMTAFAQHQLSQAATELRAIHAVRYCDAKEGHICQVCEFIERLEGEQPSEPASACVCGHAESDHNEPEETYCLMPHCSCSGFNDD